MKYLIDKQDKYTLFHIHEEKLDTTIAPKLKTEFFTLYQTGMVNLILDMSMVKYVDSSGLSAILVAKRLSEQVEGSLVMAGVSEHVLKLVKISKLDNVLTILPTIEEAVDAVYMAALEKDIQKEQN
ncbi:STAS domain-containing protein [Hugenholtzia roseola]|uniref:STAS domain-containing protein n=1 Tax=Hugenholtzia roseola TaxID=1002 RepID=UPI000419E04A|nr:STAS domain-containing protein [Hugenholtzia roseola]